MDTQDRQKSADGKIWERWVEIISGIYAKYVSIRGDISNSDPLPVKISGAGENHIGATGGNSDVISDEMVRPADTTQYAMNDVLSCNIAVVGVTIGPGGLCKVEVAAGIIDVTLKDGDLITIASIVGTTEANGDNFITKFDATHFTTPIPFVHAYTSGGTIARMFQMDLARVAGGTGLLNFLKLKMNSTVTLNCVFDCYMFFTPPSAILDNAQQTCLYTNSGIFIGTFVAGVGGTGSGGTGSDSILAMISNINAVFKVNTGKKKVYFRLVNTTTTGYIPTSGEKATLIAAVIQD